MKQGFTLLELVVSLLIVAILSAIVIVVYGNLDKKTFPVVCRGNLKSLYNATYGYIGDHRKWPQEPQSNEQIGKKERVDWWLETLKPYAVEKKHWQCPAHLDKLPKEALEVDNIENYSYEATTFDERPTTPFKWSNQPWFMEIVPYHEDGSMYYVRPDGSIKNVNDNLFFKK